MHNFKLGDRVYHPVDRAPFIVTAIREKSVEITGDWSGGTHNVNQPDWVDVEEIEPYDDTRVEYYIKGKPFRTAAYVNKLKQALLICHDIIRDIDIYEDTHMEHSKIKECVAIASNGLDKLYKEYPDLFLLEAQAKTNTNDMQPNDEPSDP